MRCVCGKHETRAFQEKLYAIYVSILRFITVFRNFKVDNHKRKWKKFAFDNETVTSKSAVLFFRCNALQQPISITDRLYELQLLSFSRTNLQYVSSLRAFTHVYCTASQFLCKYFIRNTQYNMQNAKLHRTVSSTSRNWNPRSTQYLSRGFYLNTLRG